MFLVLCLGMIEASKNGDLDKVRSSLVEIFFVNRRVIVNVVL